MGGGEGGAWGRGVRGGPALPSRVRGCGVGVGGGGGLGEDSLTPNNLLLLGTYIRKIKQGSLKR